MENVNNPAKMRDGAGVMNCPIVKTLRRPEWVDERLCKYLYRFNMPLLPGV